VGEFGDSPRGYALGSTQHNTQGILPMCNPDDMTHLYLNQEQVEQEDEQLEQQVQAFQELGEIFSESVNYGDVEE
jgi:hypothetical protein